MTSEPELLQYFDQVTIESKDIFESKIETYGPSFLILRPHSLADKLWIKARRIRELETLEGESRVPEGIHTECLAIINYSATGLMMGWYHEELPDPNKITDKHYSDAIVEKYDETLNKAREIMRDKTHDYGQAWHSMYTETMTDFVLEKILRLKSITKTDAGFQSEKVTDEFVDIMNYTVMYLAKLESS